MSQPIEHPPEHVVSRSNPEIAAQLEELADLLEAQGANVFRVRAYRAGAQTLRDLSRPVADLLDAEGLPGLLKLPGIGYSLARSIEKLCRTGRLPLLQRLRGEAGPEHLFMTLPGIGLEMASRIHAQLGIESLPELEAAASDGRLAHVPGMGPKRVQGIRETLFGRLYGSPAYRALSPPPAVASQPTVKEILDVDAEYRQKAAAGQLRLIAPQRLNPEGRAWLPVLHTQREDRHYTALYSNTLRAHELGMTHDWVVIYRDDDGGHGQWTVITAQFRPLRGRRIVRGRESECAAYYAQQAHRVPQPSGPPSLLDQEEMPCPR